jgi:hypothetical protein
VAVAYPEALPLCVSSAVCDDVEEVEMDTDPLAEKLLLPDKEPLREPDMEGVALPLGKVVAVAYPEALPLGVSIVLDDEKGVAEAENEPLADWLPQYEEELQGVSIGEGVSVSEDDSEALACADALTLWLLIMLPENDAEEEADPEFTVLLETE